MIPEADIKPSWEPNRNPVNFDHKLATKAIAECRAMARHLRKVRARRVILGDEVLIHWRGQHQREWAPDHKAARSAELEMAEHLEGLATRIQGWADAATEEEDFRQRQIDRWEAEYIENTRNAARSPVGR